jgi:YidC/Oxa1 family membrane protein insertase
MSRITPQLQKIQDKYKDDPTKQQQEIQELYKREGVSAAGGCLWSFLPILVLIPLYQVVRQPLVYMLHLSAEDAQTVVKIVTEQLPDLFTDRNEFYAQMIASAHMAEYADLIKAALPNVSQRVLEGLNFNFLGVDLSAVPSFANFTFTWARIGSFLIPLLSAGSQVVSMLVSQKMNNSVITNEKGVEDTVAAKRAQVNNKSMMIVMPLMSLWIGLTIPVALSLYWLAQGLISMLTEQYLTKKYRKIYDEEDAIRLQKAMEEEAIEAEKERIRAEKRAANPDGITQNTSKKKLQQQKREAEEAAKAAAAKEYAAKKGIVEEETVENTKAPLSGIADRPNCKGRAYDPNRYRNTEE